MEILFLIILFTCSFLIGICMEINHKSYKIYREVYKKLPSYTFMRVDDYLTIKEEFPKVDFVWLIKTEGVLFERHHCLIDYFTTHFDPYALYWLIKYRRWFKKNIKLESIQTLDEYLAEQLTKN